MSLAGDSSVEECGVTCSRYLKKFLDICVLIDPFCRRL